LRGRGDEGDLSSTWRGVFLRGGIVITVSASLWEPGAVDRFSGGRDLRCTTDVVSPEVY
jgi:hypothetical protein